MLMSLAKYYRLKTTRRLVPRLRDTRLQFVGCCAQIVVSALVSSRITITHQVGH